MVTLWSISFQFLLSNEDRDTVQKIFVQEKAEQTQHKCGKLQSNNNTCNVHDMITVYSIETEINIEQVTTANQLKKQV